MQHIELKIYRFNELDKHGRHRAYAEFKYNDRSTIKGELVHSLELYFDGYFYENGSAVSPDLIWALRRAGLFPMHIDHEGTVLSFGDK